MMSTSTARLANSELVMRARESKEVASRERKEAVANW
jgi:hypothetical protein